MRIRFVLLSVFLLCSAQTAPWWPWQREVVNPAPLKAAVPMFLVHDLNGDALPEGILLEQDRHADKNPVISIYTLAQESRNAKLQEKLLSVEAAGDYCRSIQLRDIDGDGLPEVLVRTLSRDGTSEYLTVIRYKKDENRYRECRFRTAPGSIGADFSFTPRRGEHDPEVTVTSRDTAAGTVFRTITKIEDKTPALLVRRSFLLTPTELSLHDQTVVSTPFAALVQFLRALRAGKRFVAYKHVSGGISLPEFKTMVDSTLGGLFDREREGTLELGNWHLEHFRERRTMGWMTFTHAVPAGGKTRLVEYQAFLKNEYDEWKITLIRVIRTRTI